MRPMRLTIEYRRPSPSHCDVAVYVNHALAGTLTLRQEELSDFHQILARGCGTGLHYFLATGLPTPPPEDPS